ncbi:glycosyl hydrolase [Paenibacillus solisilvae]|uniref:beta-fructofuranosidase n=1 Tax=Paenibacillus solisilvae TaxID=2486751 RepID=A0ABW0W7Q6_9BACL
MKLQSQVPFELTAVQGDPPAKLNWGPVQELSVGIETTGAPTGDLAVLTSSESARRIYIHSGVSGEKKALSLIVEWYTDAREEPLILSVPWDSIGFSDHSVLLQYTGHAVRLYVDGVLVDEDWPMGSVDLSDSCVHLYKNVTRVLLWKEAVSPECVDRNLEDRILGAEPATLQYWKPRGFNTGVGDCMPYFDGENFRLFYLYDRRGHASKWGLGAHQWAQISTKDFRSWTHHPIAVGITDQGEGSICTGSLFLKDGIYYAFYAVRAVDGSPARLTWAISSDGINFTKTGASIRISDRYSLASVRDPHVFQDQEGKYHMLVTTSLVHEIRNQGCLAHLVSDNLSEWTELEPFIVPGYHDEPECSDFFEWNGWYYLIFSNDGLARYRYSRNPQGPWLRPAMDVFDCVQWRVPKTAPFPEGRRIAAGFLASPGKYGGELVFRELIQQADGSLGLGFVPELEEKTGPSQSFEGFTLDGASGFVSRGIGSFAPGYVISFEVKAHYPNMFFGFSVADSESFMNGYDIRFEPAARKAGIHRIHAPSLQEDESSSIYQLEGLSENVSVKAVVKEGWIDLCVNGSRTIISRISRRSGSLRVFAQFGSASFERIIIREING